MVVDTAWEYRIAAMSEKTRNSTQFAALPCRVGANGQHQIMLLTSRETRRWVIPKGWPMHGLKPRKVPEREDYEEAGLVGRIIGRHPVGVFHYEKQLPEGQLLCEVRVFLFWVDGQLVDWPEKGQRVSRGFDQAEAAVQVDEGGLAEIIRSAFTPAHPREPIHKARAWSSKLPLPLALG